MSVLGLFLLGQGYFERRVSSLSGGEKSRLMLAVLFLSRANFLVLDEPTNHLDLESREALVEALDAYQGTVLMVAHDRHLLSEVADQIWEMTPEGLVVYERGYDEYAEARKNRLGNVEGYDSSAPSRTSGLSRDDMRRLKREQAEARNALHRQMKPLQEKFAKLEKELEDNLNELAKTEALLADPEIYEDGGQTTELLKNYHTLQAESERILEKMAKVEIDLAPYEEKRLALQGEE